MKRAILAVLVSVVLSALVWAVSPFITGRTEPWDAEGPFYVVALALTGAVAGGLFTKPLWAHYLGAVLGQISYGLLFIKIGPLFAVGVLLLFGYSLIFFAAAAIVASVRTHVTSRAGAA